MLSRASIELLAKLLSNICEGEKSVKNSRNNFKKINDFNPYMAFSCIDREKKNYINEYNIVEFLR